jgi:hypothetical protein
MPYSEGYQQEVRTMWLNERTRLISVPAATQANTLEAVDRKIKSIVCDIESTKTSLLDHSLPSEFRLLLALLISNYALRGHF